MDIRSRRDELAAWLVLLRAPGIGVCTLRARIERHGTAATALEEMQRDPSNVDADCRTWLRAPDRARIAADLDWLERENHHLLTFDADDYPALLRETPGAPAALFVAGDATLLWHAQVAIVGSRSATHAGRDHARMFASALAAGGFAITSGLAEGIDGVAHAAALDAGGATIAVLGTGPDRIYPARHEALAARITQRGALVSEFPPGTPARPDHFPRRNRIIAGLALGTLVVEAGVRSGSLITARSASEQGREVFAIPGSIDNPLARGCHRLIRQGVALVESADEIVESLAPLAARLGLHLRARLEAQAPETSRSEAGRVPIDPETARVLGALGHEAVPLDRLAERTGLAIARLSSMLLMLELEGAVGVESGGAYVRRGSGASPGPSAPS